MTTKKWLSYDQLALRLNNITYYPGWTFSIIEDEYEGNIVIADVVMPNAYKPEEVAIMQHQYFVPPMPSLEYFNVWLDWRIKRAWVHEHNEFLRVNGKPMFDPHERFTDAKV